MSAIVLAYHGIDDGPPPLFVDAGLFERHMDCIVESEATAMTVSGLAAALRSGELPERAVAITFDDGFTTVVRDAVPLLRERNLPATVFCVAGHLGGTNDFATDPAGIPKRDLASAAELRGAADGGELEIGAHGMRHAPLPGLSDESLREELVGSRDLLQREVGVPVTSFAYPYAVAPDSGGLRLARETYGAACAGGLAPVSAGADPHLLPRVDAHYLRRPALMARALAGGLGPYMAVRRIGARARRIGRRDYVTVS